MDRGDVAYIIAPYEREEFLKLTNDKDRDRFIVNFWERRDPTPDTTENEFKEEHYRRIAYSNFHFADTLPGWKTDRGRVYIVFGPVREMSALPAGAGRGWTEASHAGVAVRLWQGIPVCR